MMTDPSGASSPSGTSAPASAHPISPHCVGPAATVALYGPTADLATKIAVGIISDERNSPDLLERWVSEDIDVRRDSVVGEQIRAFQRQHQDRSVVVTDSVIGCPHEEGIDYPEGQYCPHCPYWVGHDRFTHERIH